MSDVFAMGVFVASLASNATTSLSAKLLPGFWFFVSYCLVSLLALQVMYVDDPRDKIPAYAPVVSVEEDDDEDGNEGRHAYTEYPQTGEATHTRGGQHHRRLDPPRTIEEEDEEEDDVTIKL